MPEVCGPPNLVDPSRSFVSVAPFRSPDDGGRPFYDAWPSSALESSSSLLKLRKGEAKDSALSREVTLIDNAYCSRYLLSTGDDEQ